MLQISVEERRDIDLEIERRYLYDATFKQRVDLCAEVGMIEHIRQPVTQDESNEIFHALIKTAALAIVVSEKNL